MEKTECIASPIQKQFWLLQQIDLKTPAYNISSLFNVTGLINEEALKKSAEFMLRQQSIFRTGFRYYERVLQQVVFEYRAAEFTIVDTALSGYVDDIKITQMMRQYIEKPFDLEIGGLVRICLFKTGVNHSLLLFVMHHTVCDLKTKELFAHEFERVYQAFCEGSVPESGVVVEYTEYSEWYTEWLISNARQKAAAYWEKHLEGAPAACHLPLDYFRQPVVTLHGDVMRIAFPQGLQERLLSFCETMVTKPFLVMLSAYCLLLHKYSRQQSVVVGVPLSNRKSERFAEMFGCCVNIIPLHIDFSNNPTCREVLSQVRKAMLGGHRYQELPFEQIVEFVKTERTADRNPLFQVGFTFDHPMQLMLSGCQVEPVYIHHGGAQLDLFATFWTETTGEINGVFEYNTDLFTLETIKQFQTHYLHLLTCIIENSEQSVNTIQVLSTEEMQQVCFDWNATDVPLPEKTIIDLFLEKVTMYADKEAIADSSIKLTYSELDQLSSKLALELVDSGVASGEMIGVTIDRSVMMVVALLAVFKVSGSYLPLDPAFPEDRLNYMLDSSGCRYLLAGNNYANRFSEKKLKTIVIKEVHDYRKPATILPIKQVVPEQTAYVLYTSGSTGLPKGVSITQKNMLNFIMSMLKKPGFSDKSRIAAVTTLSFDISVLELFCPLVAGGYIRVVNREESLDGSLLSKVIERENINIMQATPTTWRLLLASKWRCNHEFTILCGGEKFPDELVHELLTMTDNVWNMYGPTEATVWSTCQKMEQHQKKITVGKPIDNTCVYLLDEYLNPVPIGVTGFLWIGGTGVAKGYLNNEVLTRERFIENPFCKNKPEKMYNTGDLGRWTRDGTIEVLGRTDSQVKVRGFRIELGEIEMVMKEVPDVEDVVVVVTSDPAGNDRLTGYIQTKKTIDENEVRNHLKRKLPAYMVPNLLFFVETFPLTANGKVDRVELQKVSLPVAAAFRPEKTMPESNVEKNIMDVWREVLGSVNFGTNDNFFDCGGNSMLLIEVQSRLVSAVGKEVPVAKMFQYPTISLLAQYIHPESDSCEKVDEIVERVGKKRDAMARKREIALLRKKNG